MTNYRIRPTLAWAMTKFWSE